MWGSRGTPSQSQPASRPQLLEARPSGGRGAGGSGCGGLGRLHATVGGLRVGRWERPLPHMKASWGASPASHPNCRKPVGKTPQAEPVVSGTSTRQGSPAAALGRQRKRGGWWRSALRGLHPAASAHRGAGGGEAVPSLTRVRECACACVRGATPHSHCVLGKDKSAPVRKVPQAACGPLSCPALQPAPCISDPLSQHSTVRGLRAQTGGASPLPHPQSMPIPLGSQRTSGRAGAGCSDSLLPSQTPQVLHHRRADGRFQARPSKPTPEPFLNASPHRARTPAAGVQAPGRRCSQTARGIAGPEFRVSGPCTASLSLAQGGPAGIRT